ESQRSHPQMVGVVSTLLVSIPSPGAARSDRRSPRHRVSELPPVRARRNGSSSTLEMVDFAPDVERYARPAAPPNRVPFVLSLEPVLTCPDRRCRRVHIGSAGDLL